MTEISRQFHNSGHFHDDVAISGILGLLGLLQ